jgi:plastocyanin
MREKTVQWRSTCARRTAWLRAGQIMKGATMGYCLRMTHALVYLMLATVLLTGCAQERGTARQGGLPASDQSSAATPATDQKDKQKLTYVSAATARAADQNAVDLAGKETAVRMTNSLKYVPEEVTISVGQTVVWTNTSSMFHTVTDDPALAQDRSHAQLPEGAQPFNSGNIAPGDVFQRTFEVPGTYVYFCIPHEAVGMIGKIIVQKKQ